MGRLRGELRDTRCLSGLDPCHALNIELQRLAASLGFDSSFCTVFSQLQQLRNLLSAICSEPTSAEPQTPEQCAQHSLRLSAIQLSWHNLSRRCIPGVPSLGCWLVALLS